MKKNRDEPPGLIIHIYMELSQGNSLHSYLYLKQATMSFFSSFFFSSTKSENSRTEKILSGVMEPVGSGGDGERV
jgi:hypothetical protein